MNKKKIIKLTSSQAQLMTLKSLKTTMNKPVIYSTVLKENISLLSQQIACGLFNPINNDVKNDADGIGKIDNFIDPNNNQNEEKSKKYLNEVPLIDNAAENSNLINDEFNLDLENENLVDFFSSNESKHLQECFEQISPNNLNSSDECRVETSPNNLENFSFNSNVQINEQDQQIIANDPFLNDLFFSQNQELSVTNQYQPIDTEHLYASKRQLDQDETNDIEQVSEKSNKKQRTKGIYRAKDVKTDQDLDNYIERRLKNNKSSKISRSNKKALYNQMEQKSSELELKNTLLREKIEKLQSNISTLKSYLISNLNSN